ncbi:MAG: AraC family transcriptional regulator, partial [Myxococcota bacterium]
VARAVGASARTVQRRLSEEGTTYRGVLDQTRAQLATHYLTRTQITPAEVAFLIGYDDPNSFYPAFRNWTGMTPQAVRAGAKPAE